MDAETIKTQEYLLGRLTRRAEFLKDRIQSGTFKDPVHELNELRALIWAASVLKPYIKDQKRLMAHFAHRFAEVAPGG